MARDVLPSLLIVDALLALAFGVASWCRPLQTYGTIVQLDPVESHLGAIAALTSLSMYYTLSGVTCLLAAIMPTPYRQWLASVMLLRHLASGVKGYFEVGAPWQIGSPWPDLGIHVAFTLGYAVVLGAANRGFRKRTAQ